KVMLTFDAASLPTLAEISVRVTSEPWLTLPGDTDALSVMSTFGAGVTVVSTDTSSLAALPSSTLPEDTVNDVVAIPADSGVVWMVNGDAEPVAATDAA